MSGGGKKAVERVLADDLEHLAQLIGDCIREAEKYREALDQADLAAEKLNDSLWKLRGELEAIDAPLSEIP